MIYGSGYYYYRLLLWYISGKLSFSMKWHSSFMCELLKFTFCYFHLQKEYKLHKEEASWHHCGKSERLCLWCFSSSHSWHLPRACMSRRCEALWERFHHSDAGDPGHWIGSGPSSRPDPFQVSGGNGRKRIPDVTWRKVMSQSGHSKNIAVSYIQLCSCFRFSVSKRSFTHKWILHAYYLFIYFERIHLMSEVRRFSSGVHLSTLFVFSLQ